MQPDGTLIGAGATAPGGWLRVAKEGGKHFIWSAEYTGAGRQLNYNDLGFMQRQNLQTFEASVGWRTLEPGSTPSTPPARSASRTAATTPGSISGRQLELNTRLHLLDFSSIFLAADYAPRPLRRPRGRRRHRARARRLPRRQAGVRQRPAPIDLRDHRQPDPGDGRRHFSTNVQASAVFHALPQLDIEILPQLTWAARRVPLRLAVGRPVRSRTSSASSQAKNVSATAPRDLHLHAAPHAAGLRAGVPGLRPLLRPPRPRHAADRSRARRRAPPAAPSTSPSSPPPPPSPPSPPPTSKRPRSTPASSSAGSTASARPSTSSIPARRIPQVETFTPPAMLDPHAFDHGATTDVVLLKLSYWWAS